MSPQSSAQQVKTQPGIVELVDKLLDKHIYSEIAELLNQHGYRPRGSARRGRHDACFTALRVAYLVQRYGLRSRYDRLRDRGMLIKQEAAARHNIHEMPLARWAVRERITAELLAHQRDETVGTFAEIHWLRRDHDLHARRRRDHVAALGPQHIAQPYRIDPRP